jgi:predicted dehydrogenase
MALERKRIVVVGAGSIGNRHARLLMKRPDLQVELCDPDQQALSDANRQIGELPQHDDFDRMLKSGPDMLLIASPHHLHVRQTIAGLKVGAHVLCEKPMADQLASALEILEHSHNSDKVLSYGFSNHFHPGMIKIKEMIDQGQIGEIRYIHFHIGTYGTLVNSRSRYQRKTKFAILMDYVHQPDLLYWILKKNPVGVYATGGAGGDLELKSNPNSITMALDYHDHLTANIHLNYLQFPDRYHCEFVGDRGWIYYDMIQNVLHFGDRQKEAVEQEVTRFDRDEIYIAEHTAFLDAIKGRRLPESSAKDALQSMIVIDAAMRSWEKKERISL